MRVLGVDPGLTRCGLGVVDGDVGRPLRMVEFGVVRTSADAPTPQRLHDIELALEAWLDRHQPDAVAVERVFSQHNVRTVMGTAQASGVAMVTAARRGIPVALHTPSEVKASVSGNGRADKAQVARDGHATAAARRPSDPGRRLRRPRARHLPHLAWWRTVSYRRRLPVGGRRKESAVIAFVSGTVDDVSLSSAVVEVGGVGLEVQCTPNTLATLHVGAPVRLPTSMVVREESLTLFGFLDEEEKTVFELLQTASGVGPKLAQAMLAVLGPDDLRRAVTGEDVKALTAVSGIGQKGAQRIILELKDRIGAPSGIPMQRSLAAVPQQQPWRGQVHAGLVGLGWSAREADRAVDAVAPQADAQTDTHGEPDVAGLLRAALRSLSKT